MDNLREKITYLQERRDLLAQKYLDLKLRKVKINIAGEYQGYLMDLMRKGLLEGYCFQTTETACLVLDGQSVIQRGNLHGGRRNYYHAWITLKLLNEEYAFDPCLNIVCKNSEYNDIFQPDIKGFVLAKEVLNMLQGKKNSTMTTDFTFKSGLLQGLLSNKVEEIYILGNNDVFSPMYRNNTGYSLEEEKGKIKKLDAHFYWSIG